MAIADRIAINSSGVIYYDSTAGANDHGTAGAEYYTVIAFHRFVQDLADDAVASGDDLIDITSATPSDRKFDGYIQVLAGYTLDNGAVGGGDPVWEHLYGGTLELAATGQRWDGVRVVAGEGADVQIIQNGAVLADDYWNSIPNGESTKGLNRDVANGISHQFLLEVHNGTADIDGRRFVGYTRVTGQTYSEFQINGTELGVNVLPLTYRADTNDTVDQSALATVFINRSTAAETVSGVNSTGQAVLNISAAGSWANGDYLMIAGDQHEYQISSGGGSTALTLNRNLQVATTGGEALYLLTQGYRGIDINNDTTNEFYFQEWDMGGENSKTFYEWLKEITAFDTTHYVCGLPGNLFRGITHELDVDGGTGTWAEQEAISWTGGTGHLLAIDNQTGSSATKIWFQLLTGVVPTDNQTITGGITSATVDAELAGGSLTARTISTPFCGQSTGSALLGAYGFGVQAADAGSSDSYIDLTGATINPPNNVTFDVNGPVNGEDRVLVGPANGSNLRKDQMQVHTSEAITVTAGSVSSATSGAGVVVMGSNTETIGTGQPSATDTPSSGTLRVVDDANGIEQIINYTSVAAGSGTLTFSGCTGTGTWAAAVANNSYISYIDKLATTDPESFTVVYGGSPRSLFVRARDGGTAGDTQGIKTFETTGSLGSGGGSATVIRTPDV